MSDSFRLRVQITALVLLFLSTTVSSCLDSTDRTRNAKASLNTINDQWLQSSTPTPPKGDEGEFSRRFGRAVTLGDSDKEAAIAEMERALEIRPDNKVALKWIADWYSTLGRPEDEATVYRRWIKVDPKDMRAHGRLASLLIRELKQFQEGLQEAQSARSLCTGRTCYVYDQRIAEAYEGLNDYLKATDYYQLYLKGSKADGDPNPNSEIRKKIAELRAKAKQN